MTELDRLRAEVARLGGPDGVVAKVNARCDHLGMRLGEVIRERDALRTLIAEADILAAYSRTDGRREWVTVGTWLRAGEVIAHMDDPRPNVGTNRANDGATGA